MGLARPGLPLQNGETQSERRRRHPTLDARTTPARSSVSARRDIDPGPLWQKDEACVEGDREHETSNEEHGKKKSSGQKDTTCCSQEKDKIQINAACIHVYLCRLGRGFIGCGASGCRRDVLGLCTESSIPCRMFRATCSLRSVCRGPDSPCSSLSEYSPGGRTRGRCIWSTCPTSRSMSRTLARQFSHLKEHRRHTCFPQPVPAQAELSSCPHMLHTASAGALSPRTRQLHMVWLSSVIGVTKQRLQTASDNARCLLQVHVCPW
jgi:hypothetical protein